MIRRWGKPAALVALLLILGAMGVVMTGSSRERSRLRWCQNNARELGRIGANEVFHGPGFESGSHFWHEIRILTYRIDGYRGRPDPEKESPEECRARPCRDGNHRHEWKSLLLRTHPFLCPVYGETEFAPDDPEAIDYRGPKAVPEIREGRAIIGADRGRNHPGGGGYVIFIDSSVTDRWSEIEEAADGSSLWQEAGQSLKD